MLTLNPYLKKYFKIALAAIIVILTIIFLLKGCGKKTVVQKPIIVNPKLIVDSANKQQNQVSKAVQIYKDSIDKLNAKNAVLNSNLHDLTLTANTLAIELRNQQQPNKQDVDNYIDVSQKRDSICDSIVENQGKELVYKDTIINKKDVLYDSLYKRFNFLAAQSASQISYENAIKPKNQFYIGGGIYGNKESIIQGANIGIMFKNKQDRQFKVDVIYDFNNHIEYGVSTYFKIHL